MIARRIFLATAVSAIAVPRFAVADVALAGGGTLTTVSDGSLVLPGEFVFGPMPQDALGEVIAPFDLNRDRLTPECNLTLLRQRDRTVLFDAGSGPDFQPTAGTLLDALDAAGVSPGDVTDVVFTHAHPDHIWGVLDDFDEPLFLNAAHHIGTAEHAYWTDPATVDTIGADRATFAMGAKRRLEAIEDRLSIFDDGAEVVPGVRAIASPGHTPGHMSFQMDDVVILGDAISNHHVAFARPDWPAGNDHDQAKAAKTRIALFDKITSDGLAIVGFHLPDGGIGRVERAGEGFRFVSG